MVFVDSAIVWPNGKIYFFSGGDYYAYDIASETMDPGCPRRVSEYWHGLDVPVQGAIVWPLEVSWPPRAPSMFPIAGKAYLFSGDSFLSYDIPQDRVDGGLLPTSQHWPGLLTVPDGDYRIDAILYCNHKVYFFKADRYYTFDALTGTNLSAGNPTLIQAGWPGLATGQRLVGAVAWPTPIDGHTKVYFFHQTSYMRFDLTDGRADSGYPLPLTGNWDGL